MVPGERLRRAWGEPGEILDGKHDDVPENDFLYKGSIDEVVAKSKGE